MKEGNYRQNILIAEVKLVNIEQSIISASHDHHTRTDGVYQ